MIRSDSPIRKPSRSNVHIEQKRTEEQKREDVARQRRRNQKKTRIVSQYHSY